MPPPAPSGPTPPTLDPAQFLARVRAASGPDGRLPLPGLASWDIFPFEGDLRVKPLADPQLPEPPRADEDAATCSVCRHDDATYLWVDARWRLRTPGEPYGVPTFLLEPRAHLDLGDLDLTHAAELGLLTVRVERVLAAMPGVGRVHVNRWGDGGAHLHIWFIVRPYGLPQLRGSCLPDWLDVLPPMPREEFDAVNAYVRAALG